MIAFTSHNIGERKNSRCVESINDDDMNRFFWWTVMKLKKKYKKNVSSGNMKIIEGKLMLLDNMSTSIIYLMNNNHYI